MRSLGRKGSWSLDHSFKVIESTLGQQRAHGVEKRARQQGWVPNQSISLGRVNPQLNWISRVLWISVYKWMQSCAVEQSVALDLSAEEPSGDTQQHPVEALQPVLSLMSMQQSEISVRQDITGCVAEDGAMFYGFLTFEM